MLYVYLVNSVPEVVASGEKPPRPCASYPPTLVDPLLPSQVLADEESDANIDDVDTSEEDKEDMLDELSVLFVVLSPWYVALKPRRTRDKKTRTSVFGGNTSCEQQNRQTHSSVGNTAAVQTRDEHSL